MHLKPAGRILTKLCIDVGAYPKGCSVQYFLDPIKHVGRVREKMVHLYTLCSIGYCQYHSILHTRLGSKLIVYCDEKLLVGGLTNRNMNIRG